MIRNSGIICAAFILASFGISGVLPLFLDGSLKLASITNAKTMQLLNQLCNESQDDKPMSRDACYGCFFRASSRQSGYPLLLSMANCADSYLNSTDYGHCASYLKSATANVSSSANPTLIYCSFLECVRQVNKNKLISECIREASQVIPGFAGTSQQMAQLYVNTSACVLAKTRCAEPNPITGGSRDEAVLLNALLVNSDYEISIVRLPFAGIADECQKYRNVAVAKWPNAQC